MLPLLLVDAVSASALWAIAPVRWKLSPGGAGTAAKSLRIVLTMLAILASLRVPIEVDTSSLWAWASWDGP